MKAVKGTNFQLQDKASTRNVMRTVINAVNVRRVYQRRSPHKGEPSLSFESV